LVIAAMTSAPFMSIPPGSVAPGSYGGALQVGDDGMNRGRAGIPRRH
jgi:hypothetical protein